MKLLYELIPKDPFIGTLGKKTRFPIVIWHGHRARILKKV